MANSEKSPKDGSNGVISEVEHVAATIEKDAEEVSEGILRRLEGISERAIFSARWLLLPLYLGLALSLVSIAYKFVQTFVDVFRNLNTMDLHETTLEVLYLLDITLLGNLVVIIVFSGYENFVSRIGIAEDSVDRPAWMGKVDYSGLKIKLIGSLVAISVIELLRDFMNADEIVAERETWRIAIHITFVISGVLFALMDFIADRRAIVELEIEKRDLEMEKLREEIGVYKKEHRHNHGHHAGISRD